MTNAFPWSNGSLIFELVRFECARLSTEKVIGAPKINVRSSLHALGKEASALARQATLICRDVRGPLPMWVRAERDVVVLVHGLFATAGVLGPLRRRIESLTCAHTASFTYAPGPGISSVARCISRAVAAISGQARVHLIGHSIGGVAVRYYVQELGADARVVQTISIASPFGGARSARLLPAPVGRDVAPGSPLLERLAQGARRCLLVPHLSIAGQADEVVSSGACLPASDSISVAGCGHNSLLYDPRVVTEIVERIRRVQAAAAVRDARGG